MYVNGYAVNKLCIDGTSLFLEGGTGMFVFELAFWALG